MPTREAMRSLGEDIMSSFELRINGIGGIKGEVGGIKGEVQNFLKQLEDSRADLKESVASEMKGFKDSRESTAKELQGELQKIKPHLKHSVGALLKGFDVELAGGQDEWQKLVSTMHSKRSGATVAKPPEAVKTTGFAAETTPDFTGPLNAGAKRHGSKKFKAGKGKSN